MNLLPKHPPHGLLEGGPLVVTASPRWRALAPLDLDQTQMRRIANAAQLFVERQGGRAQAAAALDIRADSLGRLIRMAPPWQVSATLLARIEAALGLQAGDVLAGRASAPQGDIGRQVWR